MLLSDIKVKAIYGLKGQSAKKKIVPIVLYIDVSQYSVIYCHRNTIHTFLNSPLYLESNVSRRWLP